MPRPRNSAVLLGSARSAQLRRPGNRGQCLPRSAPCNLVQIGDAFLGDDMADVVAVDHHRRDRHAAAFADLDGIQRFDEGRLAPFVEGLDRSAPPACGPARWRACRRQSDRARAGSVWRRPRGSLPMFGAPPKPARRPRVTVEELPSRSICSVEPMNRSHGVLPGQLAEDAVGAQAAVGAGEEDVGAGADVVLHADLAAEAVHAFDPAALDGRDQRRMRIEGPVAADLAFETQAARRRSAAAARSPRCRSRCRD